MKTEKAKVIIVMDGGLIQSITTNQDADFVVLDYDYGDSIYDSPEQMRAIPQGDGTFKLAYEMPDDTQIDPERTEELYEASLKEPGDLDLSDGPICLTCGTREENPENGYCVNGHDNWVEARDEEENPHLYIEARIRYGK